MSSASGAQGSIGGWANTTDMHGFSGFGFISGNSSAHEVHVMKSGYFSVLDYEYSGAFSIVVNGHNVLLNPSQSNGEYIAKIPAVLSTYVMNITVNSSFFSEFHNPAVIFLFPFPESGRLALNNITAFIFGLASFTAVVSLAYIAVRRLY